MNNSSWRKNPFERIKNNKEILIKETIIEKKKSDVSVKKLYNWTLKKWKPGKPNFQPTLIRIRVDPK